MPTLRTPLYGSFNTRDFAGSAVKDQIFTNCIYRKVINVATGTATWYLEKRPGVDNSVSVGSGASLAVFTSPSLSTLSGFGSNFTPAYLSAFSGGTINEIWFTSSSFGNVDCGPLGSSGTPRFVETVLGGITYWLMSDGSGNCYYLASDAMGSGAGIPTFTANRTSGSVTLASVSSFTGLYVGQTLSGTGIQAGSRIASLNTGGGTLDMTLTASSGSATSTTLTRSGLAKQMDSDFPTTIGGSNAYTHAEMDGFVFTFTSDSKIFNTDLNSITSVAASSYITANSGTSTPTGIFKYRNKIVLFKTSGIEFFSNQGNATGSPLSEELNLNSKIGAPFKGCIAPAGETIYWIGPDYCLWRLNGFTPEKVNSEGNKLGQSTNTGGGDSHFSYIDVGYLYGQMFIYIAGYTAQFERMYWPELNAWTNPQFQMGGIQTNARFSGDFGIPIMAGGITTGKIYNWGGASTTVYRDDSTTFTMSIQLATDMGTFKRKIPSELRIVADVQGSNSFVNVYYSDDEGVTWSSARTISLLNFDNMKLNRLGQWKGTRIWKFEHSSDSACRIKQLEIDYDIAA